MEDIKKIVHFQNEYFQHTVALCMDTEEEYFWSKNSGPDKAQNHDRNAKAEHSLAYLKNKYCIVKTYHVWTGENQFKNRYWEKFDRTVMAKDLTPFVVYSMNKRRNWTIESLDSIEWIRQIQELHKEQDVMILERVSMGARDFPTLLRYEWHWNELPIQTMHELDTYVTGRPEYRKTAVNSIFGQHPHHYLHHNRAASKEDSEIIKKETSSKRDKEKRTVLGYHLIKPPNNYETIFKLEFGRGACHSPRWAPPSYRHRKSNEKCTAMELRYDDFTQDDEYFEQDCDEAIDDVGIQKRKFYNLEDHIVENFVFLKNNKWKGQNKRKSKW